MKTDQNLEQEFNINFAEIAKGKNRKKKFFKLNETPPAKKILLVDDSVKAIAPLNIIFRNLGCETLISFDGYSAVRDMVMMQPDLIVLDWKMPGLNGGDALIRAQEQLNLLEKAYGKEMIPNFPVITFSANTVENLHRPYCPNFEYYSHWQKPMCMSELTMEAIHLLEEL